MGYNIGPKIGIDGEREFRQQISKINNTYKAMQAETKAVTKAFDAQGDEQGKLEALSKQLSKQIEVQRQKHALLEDAVKKATAQFGENSLEATRLRGVLYDTQATISTLESELSGVSKQLDGTEESMEDLGESTENAADSALTFKDIVGANLIADLTMNTLKEAASFMKNFASGSLEAAADMIAAEAQFEQTFGEMQDQASAALGQISEDTNVASTRMQGSFTRIFAFAKTAGADSSESLMIASRAMAAAADSAAYYDRSIEEATESLQAFLKGNYANDAALGISATETSRNTMANQLYAKSFKELTEAQKVDTLLAMVEAGNKASGAMGQAARESDSWGNVMGELTEMFRQMQAQAGKPALKALTPVIQRITKAGYNLIEGIDWEKFGRTLEKIIDTAVDRGPGILRLLAGIVSAIAAFKVATLVSNSVRAARAFLGMGEAAKAAGKKVAASGAAAASSPWIAVGSLIAGVVGYICASNIELGEAQSTCEKVTESLKSTYEEIQETFTEAEASAKGSADQATYYIAQLQELEEAGLNTAESQRQYRDIVAQLGSLMPDLNLEIDENTGLLKESAEALLDQADALYENALQTALYDKLSSTIQLEADATVAAASAKEQYTANAQKLTTYLDDLQRKEEALAEIETELTAIQKKLTSGEKLSAKERHELTVQTAELEDRQNFLNTETWDQYLILNKLLDKEKDLNKTISKSTELAEEYRVQISADQLAVDAYAQSTLEAANAEEDLQDAQQALITSMDNLVLEYTEAEAAARESIDSQIGLFEDLSAESDWSAAKVIANWESQQRAFSNYEKNLQKAVEMKLAPELLQQLSDGSVESMQILDKLVNDSGTTVDEINAHFARTEEARDSVSSTMAAIQSDLIPKWQSIEEDAKEAGGDIVAGAIQGVKENAPSFYAVMYKMGLLGNAAFDKANDRNSPAKKYIASTRDVVAGAVVGVKQYEDTYAKAMAGLASLGNNAFLQEKLDAAVGYPDMVSAASSVTNNRSVTNMGGFNVQIYQQPGESAEDLAYRLMDIIHDEVAVKEAVFSAK